MQKTSVLVVVLTGLERHGWVHPHLAMAMTQWAADERLDLEFRLAEGAQGGPAQTSQEARNQACKWLLESDHTHLLMVDNDTVPSRDGALVNLPELALLTDPDGQPLDVMAAPIPVYKDLTLHLNCYMRQPCGLYRSTYVDEFQDAKSTAGLLERDAVGTGVICIRRAVVEALSHTSPIWATWEKYLPAEWDGVYVPFYRPRHVTGETVLGEDLVFCERSRALGFRCWASLPHLCGHSHTVDLRTIPDVRIANLRPPAGSDAAVEGDYTRWTAEDYGLPPETPMPKLTGFSSQPGTCRLLRELIQELQPDAVIEFGSGISTIVLRDALDARCVISFESDADTARRNKAIYAPLVDGWYQPPDRWMDGIRDARRLLVFVDGPSIQEAGPHGRRPALDFINRYFPGWSGAIVLDDVNRPGEQADFMEWIESKPGCQVQVLQTDTPLPKRIGVLRVL